MDKGDDMTIQEWAAAYRAELELQHAALTDAIRRLVQLEADGDEKAYHLNSALDMHRRNRERLAAETAAREGVSA